MSTDAGDSCSSLFGLQWCWSGSASMHDTLTSAASCGLLLPASLTACAPPCQHIASLASSAPCMHVTHPHHRACACTIRSKAPVNPSATDLTTAGRVSDGGESHGWEFR